MDHPRSPNYLRLALHVVLLSVVLTVGSAYAGAPSGVLTAIAPMLSARAAHSATRLLDGSVLIAGGMVAAGQPLTHAELYEPQNERFIPTGSLNQRRVGHTSTLLEDGHLLIAGGWGRGPLDSAELYDPAAGMFTLTGAMTTARGGSSATRLHDGRVLITGGSTLTEDATASAEIYDPTTETFTVTDAMMVARSAHSATLLADGRVLIAGGGAGDEISDSAELYDPAAGVFISTGALFAPRYKHAAALLDDGRVLIAGGSNAEDWRGQYSSAEIYDPATGSFVAAGSLSSERFKLSDALAVLPDGRVLVAGGSATVEVYDPVLDRFITAGDGFDEARYFATATLLPSGEALIVGGYNREIVTTAGAWLFTPHAR